MKGLQAASSAPVYVCVCASVCRRACVFTVFQLNFFPVFTARYAETIFGSFLNDLRNFFFERELPWLLGQELVCVIVIGGF